MKRDGFASRTIARLLVVLLVALDAGLAAAQSGAPGAAGPAPGVPGGLNGGTLPAVPDHPARDPRLGVPPPSFPTPMVSPGLVPLQSRCRVVPASLMVQTPGALPATGLAPSPGTPGAVPGAVPGPGPGAAERAAVAAGTGIAAVGTAEPGQLPRLDIERRGAGPGAVTDPTRGPREPLPALNEVVRAPHEEISRIEAGYRILPLPAATPGPLRQFGYDMFGPNVSTFAPVDDVPVGPDYVLGPGDDVTIHVWGAVDSTVVRTVDRNGRIVLPKVGDLRVWGLTFSEADRLIREQLARYFRGFNTSVTMGRLRTIRVHVVGEVCQPGVYTLSSLATLTNALYTAGGPTKLGSLREVRLLRNHHTVGTLDLYDFLLRGDRTRDFRLESGDTIFVPTIGDVVAITGEVKRPAIYELAGQVRVADLIALGGGITPSAYLKRVQIVRAQPSAERVTLDVDLARYFSGGDPSANPVLNAGDLVLIHPSDPRIYNVVRILGAVKYPGVYELRPMTRISEVLSPERLLPEAHTEQVEVARRAPDLNVEILRVNLRAALAGDRQADLVLKPLDEITVRTALRPARTVQLNGEVARPGAYVIEEGERLSSVIERAGGFTERAYLRGAIFTRAALRTQEQERLDEFVKLQEQRLLASAGQEVVSGLEKQEQAVSAGTLQARRELLKALAGRVAVGRMVVKVDTPGRLRGTQNDVVLLDGDTLTVPQPPASVLVLGAVRNPTSVLYQPGADLQYYLDRVGGLSKEADNREVHIVRADGSAISSFTKVRDLEPGDTIIVPPREEVKVRLLPTFRDAVQILGSTLLTLAALAVLF